MCYSSGMYSKGFVPGDIVFWWYEPDEGPREICICKVVSIKMARYLYKKQVKSTTTVDNILKNDIYHSPIFVYGPDDSEGKDFIGWMSEKDLFKFDKTAEVLYGTRQAIDCARRLARKR